MAEEKKKKHAGHGFKRSHIEHFKDGSHSIHHEHENGAHADVKHAVQNLEGVHDSLQDHIGVPNAGESEAMAGQHGVAEPMASQAGLPMQVGTAAPGAMGA